MLNVYAIGILRLVACCIFAAGAIWLASMGKDGWDGVYLLLSLFLILV